MDIQSGIGKNKQTFSWSATHPDRQLYWRDMLHHTLAESQRQTLCLYKRRSGRHSVRCVWLMDSIIMLQSQTAMITIQQTNTHWSQHSGRTSCIRDAVHSEGGTVRRAAAGTGHQGDMWRATLPQYFHATLIFQNCFSRRVYSVAVACQCCCLHHNTAVFKGSGRGFMF